MVLKYSGGMNMEQLLSQLEEILENEATLYSQILSIGNQKTDIIIKGKVNELSALVEQEQEIVAKLTKLELSRNTISSLLHKELNLSNTEITLTELISHVKGKHASSLMAKKDRLLDTLNSVKKINDENGKLIDNSLEFIDFSINVLSNAADPGNNYTQVGYANGSGKSSMFDMKL